MRTCCDGETLGWRLNPKIRQQRTDDDQEEYVYCHGACKIPTLRLSSSALGTLIAAQFKLCMMHFTSVRHERNAYTSHFSEVHGL